MSLWFLPACIPFQWWVCCYVITSFIYAVLMKNDVPLPFFFNTTSFTFAIGTFPILGPVYMEMGDPR